MVPSKLDNSTRLVELIMTSPTPLPSSLSANLRRVRAERGLSQSALALMAGLSRTAYVNVESGESVPRADTLAKLASVLKVGLDELMAAAAPVTGVRFRSKARVKDRELIIAGVLDRLRRYSALEDRLGESCPPERLLRLQKHIKGQSIDAVKTARLARLAFDVPETLEKIPNLPSLLEKYGIRVLMHAVGTEESGFYGLSIADQPLGPAIVVNTWRRLTLERRRFSVAHELGHLVLHSESFNVRDSEEHEREESEADAFASEFLMPSLLFKETWDESAGLHFVDAVLAVKARFGVSYSSVLMRAGELRVASGNLFQRFYVEYRRRFGRPLESKSEPQPLTGAVEFEETRLRRLVRRAFEDGLLSSQQVMQLLTIDLEDVESLTTSWSDRDVEDDG